MLGATLGLLAVVAAAQRVIGWILVAATLAGLLHPLVSVLARRMPRAAATAIVMLTLVGTLGTVGYGIVDDIQGETRRLQDAGPARARELERSERFGEFARDIRLAERTDEFLRRLPERLRGGTTAEALQAAATRGVAFLATGVLTVFFLQHGPRLARAAGRQIHDARRRERLGALGAAVYRRAFGYAGASLAMSLAAGLAGYLVARMAEVPGPAALGSRARGARPRRAGPGPWRPARPSRARRRRRPRAARAGPGAGPPRPVGRTGRHPGRPRSSPAGSGPAPPGP